MSVNRCSTKVSLVVPVTILAASFWIVSSLLCIKLIILSKITPPYANRGLIKYRWIVSKDLLSSVNFSGLMTFIRFQSFL